MMSVSILRLPGLGDDIVTAISDKTNKNTTFQLYKKLGTCGENCTANEMCFAFIKTPVIFNPCITSNLCKTNHNLFSCHHITELKFLEPEIYVKKGCFIVWFTILIKPNTLEG